MLPVVWLVRLSSCYHFDPPTSYGSLAHLAQCVSSRLSLARSRGEDLWVWEGVSFGQQKAASS